MPDADADADDRTIALDIIGAGTANTDRPGATGAAYLVRNGSSAILLDLGQGSFPRLAGTLEPSTLDAIVVSHLHPDHFIDLVALRHYLTWEFRPARRVRVVAPYGLERRLDALHDEDGFCAHALDIEAVRSGPTIIGDLAIEAARVRHTSNSHAYRVSIDHGAHGRGLIYSGDCGRADDMDVLIRPGDTLLSEVSFGPGPVPPGAEHLDGPAVGALAARTGVGRVLLSHIQMGFDPTESVASVWERFDGPVELVEPGRSFRLPG
jgi:ribonuclease BN (tRNA processing enzyme)